MAENKSATNGRGFVGDRERFTGQARRELILIDERAAAAQRQISVAEAALKRFEAHLGEAFLEKKDPPRAAVDLQNQLREARQTLAACIAVRPDKQRGLEAREAEWAAKAKAELEAGIRELLERRVAATRALAALEAEDAVTLADYKHAAPWFPLPELPVTLPKLNHLLEAAASYPPKPAAAPPGTIRVRRLPGDRIERLDPLDRLFTAVGEAYVRLNLNQYNPGEVFGIPPKITMCRRGAEAKEDVFEVYDTKELLGPLGLEKVADEPGATP